MANRLLTQFFYSFLKKLCSVHVAFSVGAVGAPTLIPAESLGVSSVSRTGAGEYQVVLQDKWYSFITFRGILEAAASEDIGFQILSYDLAAKTIDFSCHAAGVSTDPSNGSKVRVELLFNDTVAR